MNPDIADSSREIVINEFLGLNEVSPNGMSGQPTRLVNVYFDRYGGYRASDVIESQNRAKPILNTFNPLPTGITVPDCASYDYNNVIVFKDGATIYLRDLDTGNTLLSVAAPTAANGWRNLAPKVVMGWGNATSTVNDVTVVADGAVYSIGIQPTLINNIQPSYQPNQVFVAPDFIPANFTSVYSDSNTRVNGGNFTALGGRDAGAFALYKNKTKVGWSPQLAAEHYVLIYLVPKNNGTTLNPNTKPALLYPLVYRVDTRRTLFTTNNTEWVTSPPDLATRPDLYSTDDIVFGDSKSVNEFSIYTEHNENYDVVAYGLAYPFTERQTDMVYIDGFTSKDIGRIEAGFVPNRQFFRANRVAGNFAVFVNDASLLPPTGKVLQTGDYYIGFYYQYEQARFYRVTLKITQGGTVPARTPEVEAALTQQLSNYQDIITDGTLKYQVIADMAAHHEMIRTTSGVGVLYEVGNDSQMTFENYIKGAAFPPIPWLGQDVPDWFGSNIKNYGEWSRLETVSIDPNRTRIYRNISSAPDLKDFELPAVTPVAGITNWYQNRSWIAAISVNRTQVDQRARLTVNALPLMPIKFTQEVATNRGTIYYSNLYKPWRFVEEFIIPMFKKSFSIIAMRTVGNAMIIHGENDACVLTGSSKANFQVQHLDIAGVKGQRQTCVAEGTYYWLGAGHLYRLNGSQPSSVSEGKVAIPLDIDNQASLAYHEIEKIIYVDLGIQDSAELGTKILMYHLFNEQWSQTQGNSYFLEPPQIIEYSIDSYGKVPAAFIKFNSTLPPSDRRGEMCIYKQSPNYVYPNAIIEWKGIDAGNQKTRKRWVALHVMYENNTAIGFGNDISLINFSTELEAAPPHIVNLFVTGGKHSIRTNIFGRIAALKVVTRLQFGTVLRPKLRIEVVRQTESLQEFDVND